MRGVGAQSFAVTLPIVNHTLVIDVEPDSVIRRNEKFVVVVSSGNEVAAPSNREVVNGAAINVTSLRPAEADSFVRADECRRAFERIIVEVFAFQTLGSGGRSHKLRVLDDLIELQILNNVVDAHAFAEIVADALQIADGIEWLGERASAIQCRQLSGGHQQQSRQK